MVTIQSLPAELIRHTLSFVYPPGQANSYSGLAQTALVHKAWVGPSRSLLTEVLEFDGSSKESLALFVEGGPSLFSSQAVSFSSQCPEGEIRGLLGKAKAGGIRKLKIEVTKKCALVRVFNFASVQSE
jgi:hypothetical protein